MAPARSNYGFIIGRGEGGPTHRLRHHPSSQWKNPWTLGLSCSRMSNHASTVDRVIVEGWCTVSTSLDSPDSIPFGPAETTIHAREYQSGTTETSEGGVDALPCWTGGLSEVEDEMNLWIVDGRVRPPPDGFNPIERIVVMMMMMMRS